MKALSKRTCVWLASLLVAAEGTLFYFILFAPGGRFALLSVLSVAVCCAFCAGVCAAMKSDMLVCAALVFTLVADSLLAFVRPAPQAWAMVAFSAVQLCYFARQMQLSQRKKERCANCLVRAVFVVLGEAAAVWVVGDRMDAVVLLSVLYLANLLANILFAFLHFGQDPLLAIGLLLFLCCDLFVGFRCAIGIYIHVPTDSLLYRLAFADFNFAWFFYIPSQTLISLGLLFPFGRRHVPFAGVVSGRHARLSPTLR